MVSIIIDNLGRRGALVGFNQEQMRDILNSFQDEIMNEIGGGRLGRRRGV